MKKITLILGIAGSVAFLMPTSINAQAPTAKSTMTSPSDDLNAKAERQTERAAKELALNEEQKSKFKKFDIDRLYKIQPINEKIKATKDENEKAQLKAQKQQINQEFFNNVNSILTPAQQELWKKKFEEEVKKGNADHSH
jgi:Spy/CpxP family protein refolding chaperone